MSDLRALLGDKYDDVIERAARAAAESSDTCFEDLDAWNARPEWQRSEDAAWDESIEGAEESAEYWRNQLATALAAVLPDLLADAWDEGHADGLHNAHEHREHRKMRNPYRPETATTDAAGAPGTLAAPDAT